MKNLKLWLIASLCVNLLLVGLLAGGLFKAEKEHKEKRPRDEIGAMMLHAPEGVRESFRKDMRSLMIKQREKGGKPNILELVKILEAPEFDPEALKAYFEKSREANFKNAKHAHERLVKDVTAMSPQERADMARNMKARFERAGPRKN